MIICDPRYPPPPGAIINWQHPMADALCLCLLLNSTGNVVDWIGQRCSSVGISDQSGLRDWSIPNAQIPDLQFTSGPWSVAANFYLDKINANGEYTTILGQNTYVSESNNQGWSLSVYPPDAGTANNYIFSSCSNSNTGTGTSNALAANRTVTVGNHILVGTSDGTTRTVYADYDRNTVLVPTTATNPNPLASTSNLNNATAGTTSNPLFAGYAWNRCLSKDQAVLLYNEPYPFFTMPISSKVFLFNINIPTGSLIFVPMNGLNRSSLMNGGMCGS